MFIQIRNVQYSFRMATIPVWIVNELNGRSMGLNHAHSHRNESVNGKRTEEREFGNERSGICKLYGSGMTAVKLQMLRKRKRAEGKTIKTTIFVAIVWGVGAVCFFRLLFFLFVCIVYFWRCVCVRNVHWIVHLRNPCMRSSLLLSDDFVIVLAVCACDCDCACIYVSRLFSFHFGIVIFKCFVEHDSCASSIPPLATRSAATAFSTFGFCFAFCSLFFLIRPEPKWFFSLFVCVVCHDVSYAIRNRQTHLFGRQESRAKPIESNKTE